MIVNFLLLEEGKIDQQTFPALSKTALEAMSCGLKIIPYKGGSKSNWLMDGESNRKFILTHHDARVVVNKLMKIYEEAERRRKRN